MTFPWLFCCFHDFKNVTFQGFPEHGFYRCFFDSGNPIVECGATFLWGPTKTLPIAVQKLPKLELIIVFVNQSAARRRYGSVCDQVTWSFWGEPVQKLAKRAGLTCQDDSFDSPRWKTQIHHKTLQCWPQCLCKNAIKCSCTRHHTTFHIFRASLSDTSRIAIQVQYNNLM